MLKFAGLTIIIAVTSFAGNYFSANLKIRLINLKKLNYMIDEIMIMLRFKSATVYEITEYLTNNERFSSFDFLGSISPESGVPFQQSWCTAVMKNPPDSFKNGDIELLSDIGRKLGTSDLDGQISTLKLQQAELESLIHSAETDYLKKAKLYRSLGVLTGAFISIMLI